MLAIGIIILAALITISQVVIAVGGPLVPQLITDMPTFFDYDDITGDMILDDDGNPQTNERIDLYWILFMISFLVLMDHVDFTIWVCFCDFLIDTISNPNVQSK